MAYWRMQLHPSDSGRAVAHTMKSLGLGYIGLEFAVPPGDLADVERGTLERLSVTTGTPRLHHFARLRGPPLKRSTGASGDFDS